MTRLAILAAEYKQLLEEIWGLLDFHDFLQPPKATDLLPSNGLVIIFNLDKTQCDALALIAGIDKLLHIPLENFSLVEAVGIDVHTLNGAHIFHMDLVI